VKAPPQNGTPFNKWNADLNREKLFFWTVPSNWVAKEKKKIRISELWNWRNHPCIIITSLPFQILSFPKAQSSLLCHLTYAFFLVKLTNIYSLITTCTAANSPIYISEQYIQLPT
jgi:hypothetical protein